MPLKCIMLRHSHRKLNQVRTEISLCTKAETRWSKTLHVIIKNSRKVILRHLKALSSFFYRYYVVINIHGYWICREYKNKSRISCAYVQVLADATLADNHHRHRTFATNGNQEGITICNLVDGETLTYSLALIRGRAPALCSYITVRGYKNVTSEWPIIAGQFRVLVDLARGSNKLELEAGGHKRRFILMYEPRTTRLRVTPVYVICAGHDGYFQVTTNDSRSDCPVFL